MNKVIWHPSTHEAAAQLAIIGSAGEIVWRSVLVVFATEFAVMLMLRSLGMAFGLWTALLDSLLLSVMALPLLYAVILKPVAALSAKQAAASAEVRFEAIARSVQDGVIVFAWDREIQFANPAVEQIFGYAPGTLRGADMEVLMPEDVAKDFREGLKRYQATGEAPVIGKGSVEEEGRRKNGERFPVELSVNPVVAGGDTHFVVVLRDITERRRAEEALRQAEEKYRGIFEEAIVGIFQTTPDGRYLSVNPTMARIYGYDSPEELMASRTDIARQAYVDPDRREEFKRLMEERGVVLDFEYEVYRKDGSKIWFLENARAVRDSSGAVMYYIGAAEDVTERKRAEEALRESERRLHEILDALPVPVRIIQAGKVVFSNPADAHLYGYGSPAEEVGADAFAQVAEEDRERLRRYAQRRAAGEEAPRCYEAHAKRRDGSIFPVEVTAERYVHAGAPASLLVLRDLTERKRLQMYEQILPVCCVCGKIRDDTGAERGKSTWGPLDQYVTRHSGAQLSHGFCPDCYEEYRKREGLS